MQPSSPHRPLLLRICGRCMVFVTWLMTGIRPRWIGVMPGSSRARIYFANHTSHLDFLVIWSALPEEMRWRTRPIAARDYWSRGRLRQFLAAKLFRAIFVERKPRKSVDHPLQEMEQSLAAGDSLILFPEGTRSDASEPGAFKGGLYHLARNHPGVELVPCYLENLNRVLPKGESLFIPLLCAVSFGPPLVLQAGETKEAFLNRARSAVVSLHSS